jgi:septum formation protein
MMSLWRDDQPLVLASRSVPRRVILEAAGIPIEICVPELDERAVEAAAGKCGPAEVAMLLAREKARAATRLMPHRIVVGADQTLALAEQRFDKPHSRAAAHQQLMMLSGKTHHLYSAVALARNGEILFDGVDTANLTLRTLSGPFLDLYLGAAGDTVLGCVGAYQLEALGIHLFDRIDGDHFTILGLPLLKLLGFLRRIGSLAG